MPHTPSPPLTIIGLAAHFGNYPDQHALARAFYLGKPLSNTVGGVTQPLRRTIPGLVRKVIRGTLADAQVKDYQRVEILTVADPDLAERVFAGLTTPHRILNILPAPQAVFQALEDAQYRLSQGKADVIVLASGGEIGAGAVALSMGGGQQPQNVQSYAILETLERSARLAPPTPQAWGDSGAQVGYLEFCGSLDQDQEAVSALCRAYAFPEGMETPTSTPSQAKRDLEIPTASTSSHVERGMEIPVTSSQGTETLATALGSIDFDGLDLSPATEMASLIKTILCLSQRFLPAFPEWEGPQNRQPWESTPFYVSSGSRFWFTDEGVPQRMAALFAPSPAEGENYHLLFSESPQSKAQNRFLEDNAWKLIPITANDQHQLIIRLQTFQKRLENVSTPAELNTLAGRYLRSSGASPKTREESRFGDTDSPQDWEDRGAYTLVLVGEEKTGLLREIDLALEGVPNAFQKEKTWHTPRGSYFTPHPLNEEEDIEQSKIAFVYPGAFNTYPNLGRDLFHLFPSLYDRFSGMTSNLGNLLAERLLYPRRLEPLSSADWRAQELRLVQNPTTIIETGIAFSMLYTALLRDYFQVTAQIALGYSLGENSMFWATEVWRDVEGSSQAWRDSDLFQTQLSGPKLAVREHWGEDAASKTGPDLWKTFILKAYREEVESLVNQEDHVYLTMVNTPREVVIAGDPERCQHVIDRLGCHSLPLPYDAVLHAPPGRRVHDTFVKLYSHPVHPAPESDTQFYSAAEYAPLKVEREVLAQALARMTTKTVDFPRLVKEAYADGARIFIELGPRHTCSRWVDKILGDQPHVSMPINKKGQEDIASLFGVLAKLLSHHVPVDLTPLLAPEESQPGVDRKKPLPASAPNREVEAIHFPTSVLQPAAMGPRRALSAHSPHPISPAPAAKTAPLQRAMAHNRQVTALHSDFLAKRQAALRATSGLIQQQASLYTQIFQHANGKNGDTPVPPKNGNGSISRQILQTKPPPLFDEKDLQEFAMGSIVQCFGPAFAPFAERRLPRIPNRELRLISRVLEIEGEQGQINPGASLVSEYDLSPDAWFYRQNAYPTLPYAVYLEMALQPCGFLSAYQGMILPYPEEDFYFRNLDGWAKLHAILDLRGGTVRNHVKLLSSSVVKGIILQKFAFQLSHKGKVFYEGESSFGYFKEQVMRNQKGLDGGQSTQPWFIQTKSVPPSAVIDLKRERSYYEPRPNSPHYRLSQDKLDYLDEVQITEGGGRYEQGYIHASGSISPDSWFFSRHFYQDPVMPGSLGVEAVLQALQAYALHHDLGRHLKSPRFTPLSNQQTRWKYRGQLTPENDSFHLEVHLSDIVVGSNSVKLVGDASVWKDDMRIYELKGIGLSNRGSS